MKPTAGFLMNADTAYEFFLRCEKRNALSHEDRMKVLKELQQEFRTVALNEEDLTRQVKGKKILRIKRGS